MHQANKLHGVGLRIAGYTALLVILCQLALGVAVFAFVSSTIETRARQDVRDELTQLIGIRNSRSVEELAAEIDHHRHNQGPRRFFYKLTRSGKLVAGDAWLPISHMGWQRLDGVDRAAGDSLREDVLILAEPLAPDLVFAVGRDVHWIGEVQDELWEILGWTTIGAIVLAVVTAYIVKRIIAGRISAITDTANAIMAGDFTQRVATTGAGDDFDRLSQTLNAMLERLHVLMENLEQVSNDIAHDLRTPLGRLRQGLEQVRSKATSIEDYRAATSRAITEADGLLETFTALLRIAQIEAGASRAAFRRTNLSEVAAGVVEAYELSVEETGRSLSSNINQDAYIQGDRDLLSQMLSNLIENALTHTPSGTRIGVTVTRSVGEVVVDVFDNGKGVPVDDREKIFRRFYRLEGSRTTPGTGLGLSLVAAIARLHGAHVEAHDNKPGLRIRIVFERSEPT